MTQSPFFLGVQIILLFSVVQPHPLQPSSERIDGDEAQNQLKNAGQHNTIAVQVVDTEGQLWKTEKGDLVELIQVDKANEEALHSNEVKLQTGTPLVDHSTTITKASGTIQDQDHHDDPLKFNSTGASNLHVVVRPLADIGLIKHETDSQETRTARTFWPFTSWFGWYDYDPYYYEPLPPPFMSGMPPPYPPPPFW